MALAATPERRLAGRVADVMVTSPKTHGPRCRPQTIREFFEDDHVHMALVVTADGRLITTIERSDLARATPGATCAVELGTLVGRTVAPSQPLAAAREMLVPEGRRRLAVVDASGRLLGLLCLKRDGTGFCSDKGIRERAEERLLLRRDSHAESKLTARTLSDRLS
jgi:CBS-domain-containing membrane protein